MWNAGTTLKIVPPKIASVGNRRGLCLHLFLLQLSDMLSLERSCSQAAAAQRWGKHCSAHVWLWPEEGWPKKQSKDQSGAKLCGWLQRCLVWLEQGLWEHPAVLWSGPATPHERMRTGTQPTFSFCRENILTRKKKEKKKAFWLKTSHQVPPEHNSQRTRDARLCSRCTT